VTTEKRPSKCVFTTTFAVYNHGTVSLVNYAPFTFDVISKLHVHKTWNTSITVLSITQIYNAEWLK
jgi:hypothetical protein